MAVTCHRGISRKVVTACPVPHSENESRPVLRPAGIKIVPSHPALLLDFRIPSRPGTGRDKSRGPPISGLDRTQRMMNDEVIYIQTRFFSEDRWVWVRRRRTHSPSHRSHPHPPIYWNAHVIPHCYFHSLAGSALIVFVSYPLLWPRTAQRAQVTYSLRDEK